MLINTPFLQRLALDNTADERAIRRAYARELKQIDQEKNGVDFQILREAYESALQWVKHHPEHFDGVAPNFREGPAPLIIVNTPASGPLTINTDRPVPRASPTENIDGTVFRASPVEEFDNYVNDSQNDAETAFANFMHGCQTLIAENKVSDDVSWKTLLEKQLSDAKLDSLEARQIFEFLVAQLLINGWQPGHLALFSAAGKVFNWIEDGGNLRKFGPVGTHMDQAISECLMFHESASIVQKKMIARLHSPVLPTKSELWNKQFLEKIAARFPSWFSIVTSERNLELWRETFNALPDEIQNKVQPKNVAGKASPIKKTSGENFTVPSFFMVFIVICLLGKLLYRPITPIILASMQHRSYPNIPRLEPRKYLRTLLAENILYVVPDNVRGNPSVDYHLIIDGNGFITRLRRIRSSGYEDFDAAVYTAILKARPYPREIWGEFDLTWHMKANGV